MKLVNTYQQKLTVLITGATGYTGNWIARAFEANNYPLVKLASRHSDKLQKQFSYETVDGDLLNDDYLEKITNEADVICHAASWTSYYGNKIKSRKLLLEPSVKLIERAEKNNVKRFVFLSSTAINAIEGNPSMIKKLEKGWPHLSNVLKIENRLKKAAKQGMEVVIMRVGFFTGKGVKLGILPMLLPRLRTRLVPWISFGETTLPMIDGQDIGIAFYHAASIEELPNKFNVLDIIGPEVPTVKMLINYLNSKYGYPRPWFNVSFKLAHFFAKILVKLMKLKDGHPLLFPAIVFLLQESKSTYKNAQNTIGFTSSISWKESLDSQMEDFE